MNTRHEVIQALDDGEFSTALALLGDDEALASERAVAHKLGEVWQDWIEYWDEHLLDDGEMEARRKFLLLAALHNAVFPGEPKRERYPDGEPLREEAKVR